MLLLLFLILFLKLLKFRLLSPDDLKGGKLASFHFSKVKYFYCSKYFIEDEDGGGHVHGIEVSPFRFATWNTILIVKHSKNHLSIIGRTISKHAAEL